MKKLTKIMITMMLVLATVLSVPTTTQAATNANKWEFVAVGSKKVVYVGQTTGCWVRSSIYGSTITWKSSNKKIATVDNLGNVTGKKAGKATVTASDGVHSAKFTVTVKAISKAKTVVFNYDDCTMEYGKTYTIKSLNGSAVKKITNGGNAKVKISGNKVTPQCVYEGDAVYLRIVLKDGTVAATSYACTSSKEREEAISIIKKAMPKYGVTTNSSDLEKAMFIYNWLGDNCRYYLSKKAGHYYAIREGKGNCSAYAEGVRLIGEVVGLQTVRVNTSDGTHSYNGVRVDGKWYLMDTTMCDAWAFSYSAKAHFLNSYEREMQLDSAMTFKVSASSLADIVFTDTKYDGVTWPEYYDNYVSEFDDDYWNS